MRVNERMITEEVDPSEESASLSPLVSVTVVGEVSWVGCCVSTISPYADPQVIIW